MILRNSSRTSKRSGSDLGRVLLRYLCRISLLTLVLGSLAGSSPAQDQPSPEPHNDKQTATSPAYCCMNEILRESYAFANTFRKDDWLAVISYDIRPYILADFTQDKAEVYGALNQLRIPGFSDTNLFDALYDTLDRVDRIEGHKYI